MFLTLLCFAIISFFFFFFFLFFSSLFFPFSFFFPFFSFRFFVLFVTQICFKIIIDRIPLHLCSIANNWGKDGKLARTNCSCFSSLLVFSSTPLLAPLPLQNKAQLPRRQMHRRKRKVLISLPKRLPIRKVLIRKVPIWRDRRKRLQKPKLLPKNQLLRAIDQKKPNKNNKNNR